MDLLWVQRRTGVVGLGLSSTLNKWLHFRGRTKVLKPHSASRLYYSDGQLSQSTRTTPLSSSMFIYAVLAQAPLPGPPSPTRAARERVPGTCLSWTFWRVVPPHLCILCLCYRVSRCHFQTLLLDPAVTLSFQPLCPSPRPPVQCASLRSSHLPRPWAVDLF